MNDEPKTKTEQEREEDFIAEYKALCKKHGLMINVTPIWKQSLDMGDWRLALQMSVEKLV